LALLLLKNVQNIDEVGGLINDAIENIDFPPGLSGDDVRGIVDSFGFATSADVQAGFDDLNDKIDNVLNGVATQFTEQEAEFAADLLGLETSVFQQLAATEGALRDELLGLGEDLDSIRADFSGRFDEFDNLKTPLLLFRQTLVSNLLTLTTGLTTLFNRRKQW
jgi:hypothetical protein